MNTEYTLQGSQIFTLLFIMLGPLRLLGGPVRQAGIAIKAGLISTLALLLGGFIGSQLLIKWNVQTEILILAAGILFFVMALKPLTQAKESEIETAKTSTPVDIAMKLIISPYGMATVTVLIALSHDLKRLMVIAFSVIAVMILNILTLAYSKKKSNSNSSVVTKILGAGLGTLQLALALQIINDALRRIL